MEKENEMENEYKKVDNTRKIMRKYDWSRNIVKVMAVIMAVMMVGTAFMSIIYYWIR